MTTRDDLVKEHRTFNKWYAGKYADQDGKFLHMPSWLKNDMRNAWLASAHESQSRITSLERQLAEETERCARVADGVANEASAQLPNLSYGEHYGMECRECAAREIAAAIRGVAK